MLLIPPCSRMGRSARPARDLVGFKRIIGCMLVVVSDTLSLRFAGRDYTRWTLDLSAARPPDALIVTARSEDRQGEVSLRAWVVARRVSVVRARKQTIHLFLFLPLRWDAIGFAIRYTFMCVLCHSGITWIA